MAMEGHLPRVEPSKSRVGGDSCATPLAIPGAGWPLQATLAPSGNVLGERPRPRAFIPREDEVILATRSELPRQLARFVRALEARPRELGHVARVVGVSRRTLSCHVASVPPVSSHR
jgi:hypothetical protein